MKKLHILVTVFSVNSGVLSKAKSSEIRAGIDGAIGNPIVYIVDVSRQAHSTSATLRLESSDLPISPVVGIAISSMVDAIWPDGVSFGTNISVTHSFFEK